MGHMIVKIAHGRRTTNLTIAAGNAGPSSSFPNSTMYLESPPIEKKISGFSAAVAAATVDHFGITIDRIAGGRNLTVGETKILKGSESWIQCRGQFGENGACGRPRGTGFTRRPVCTDETRGRAIRGCLGILGRVPAHEDE